MKNRFNQTIKKGMAVKVSHPRGGSYVDRVKSFETEGAFVRAYGKRVVLESGASCALDDCSPILG